jgi:hypothetical protein
MGQKCTGSGRVESGSNIFKRQKIAKREEKIYCNILPYLAGNVSSCKSTKYFIKLFINLINYLLI